MEANYPPSITLEGTVFTGLGEGAYYISKEHYRKQFIEKLGFEKEKASTRVGWSAIEQGGDTDTEFHYMGSKYVLGDSFSMSTVINQADMKANLKWVRDARRQADWVMMAAGRRAVTEDLGLAEAGADLVLVTRESETPVEILSVPLDFFTAELINVYPRRFIFHAIRGSSRCHILVNSLISLHQNPNSIGLLYQDQK
jgi:hypothetical protein